MVSLFNKYFFLPGIICLLLVGCPKKEDSIWFDDLPREYSLSSEELKSIGDYAFKKLNTNDLSDISLPQTITDDDNPRIVFLSISDGNSVAKITLGKGIGILNAIDDCINQFNHQVDKNFDRKWIKLDIVYNVIVDRVNLLKLPLQWERSIFGLAIDKGSKIAFLPEEIVANTILNSKQNLVQRNLIEMCKGDPGKSTHVQNILNDDNTTVFRFLTYSILVENENVIPLYRGHRMFDSIGAELVLDAATKGGKYLTSAINSDGKFFYSFLPKTSEEKDSYNIVRHSGTIFSMLQLYEVTGEKELLGKSDLAIKYLLNTKQLLSSGKKKVTCVVENGFTKLGGNALAIMALIGYYNQTNEKEYLDYAKRLGEWILAAQGANGEFVIQKQSYPDGKVIPFQSEYYPGEALLALTTLYKSDPDTKWLYAAESGARYLIGKRDKNKTDDQLAHDHWLLYAINELYRLRPNKIYIDHAMRLARVILNNQRTEAAEYRDWVGSFYTPPRSTPTATRMEALFAAYQLARDYNKDEMKQKILKGLERGIRFQLQTQFRSETAMYLDNPQKVLGGFKKSLTDYELRIDYTQHNISSLLGMYSILTEKTN